jgi:hypothetical protein
MWYGCMEVHWTTLEMNFLSNKGIEQDVKSVGYQFLAKLFKLFLPSYNYLRYLCHMHIFLGLWDILSKFNF